MDDRWTTVVPQNSDKDLLFQGTNDGIRGISWNDLGVVKHVELLGGVTSGVEHDGLLPSWMVW